MPTLVASIGTLVLFSVGSVLALNWIVDRDIVQDFATRLIRRALATQEMALREHLDAAIHQADFIAKAISDGRYRLTDPALADFVSGTLAAAPQIDGIVVSDPDGNALRVVRDASRADFRLDRLALAGDGQFAALAGEIQSRREPIGDPRYTGNRDMRPSSTIASPFETQTRISDLSPLEYRPGLSRYWRAN